MLSSVLRSERAVRVNIEIMRTFVRLRRLSASHEELARRLNMLERRSDARFRVVFQAIRKLMEPDSGERRPIAVRGGSAPDQGAEPEEYREYAEVWQRRDGGKDPASTRSDFLHGLIGFQTEVKP